MWSCLVVSDSLRSHSVLIFSTGREKLFHLSNSVYNSDVTWQEGSLKNKSKYGNRVLVCSDINELCDYGIDAFKLWCWRRLLRVPWTARRSNQSILKEINPEYSLEGLLVKLWYFVHLMRRADSLEKTLMLGKIEGRRRGQQWMRWLDGIAPSMGMSLSKLQEMVKDREAWYVAVHGFIKTQTGLNDWTPPHCGRPPLLFLQSSPASNPMALRIFEIPLYWDTLVKVTFLYHDLSYFISFQEIYSDRIIYRN